MDYYPGDEPGKTVGILPGPPPIGPYYWWQAGAMFGSCASWSGIDWRKKAPPMTAASRATAASTRSRLSGLRTGRPNAG